MGTRTGVRLAEERQEQQLGAEGVTENPFVARFEGFFKAHYMKQIERLVEAYPEKRSLDVDFRDIEHYDYKLADELLENPDYLLNAACAALAMIDVPALDLDEFAPAVHIHSLPDQKEYKPVLRNVSASHLGKMISIDGIVRMVTDVRPKLRVATWECRTCGNSMKLIQSKPQVLKPVACDACKSREFTLVDKESRFTDWQKIQIQEPLEALRGSEQPTTLTLIATDDLVNIAFPGDRLTVTGILRLRPASDKAKNTEKGLVYDRCLETIHIEKGEKEFEEIEISKEEEKEIIRLSKDKKIYEKLRNSLAQDIYGHETVKDSIILQLFSGSKKVLPDGSYTRGNIHVLLVGDPGVAKSKLLQATDRIAPKSIYVAGKMATGAGIAATAVKDEFGEGGWTIKAGALVLASGGMAMIDEFEKMGDEDRGALHEVMEQQSCSVAKAGIVTRFKAETSLLAAANPKFYRLDMDDKISDQINMPITLISRFDLIFLMQDVADRANDRAIAKHILKTHQSGQRITHERIAGKKPKEAEAGFLVPEIGAELMKKYISYARQKVFPILGDDKMKALCDFYVDFREMGKNPSGASGGSEVITATHRQLEALIRISEASARVRLSNEVENQDIERAIRIFRTTMEQIATDRSGKIDVGLITTGYSHSEADSLKKMLRIVKEKAADVDEVTRDEVVEEAKTRGIEEEKARELISKLLRSGELYTPKHGVLKPVERG